MHQIIYSDSNMNEGNLAGERAYAAFERDRMDNELPLGNDYDMLVSNQTSSEP